MNRPDPLEPPPGYGDKTRAPGGAPLRTSPPLDAESARLQHMLDSATGGLMPRWLNDEESHLDDGRCVAIAGDLRCRVTATHWVYLACPHEHVDRSGLCDSHAVLIGKAVMPWRCQKCFDATGEVVRARIVKVEPMDLPGASE